MKKVLFSLVAALMSVSAAWSDEFTVGNIEIPQGGTAELEIGLNNATSECAGFQFELYLPDGLTVATDTEDEFVFSEGSRMSSKGFTTQISWKTDHYQILSYNGSVKTMDGTSGTVIIITLKADANLAVGTVLNATLQECKMTNKDEESLLLNDVIDFTVTIGEPDDGRIHFDETSTKLPTYTAGEKGDVTLKRTIKAGQWSTIVMPFNLTKANATAIFGSDVEFAKFNGFEVDYGDDDENVIPLGITINFTNYSIPARGNLAGGTPVLIKTSKDISEIKLDQVTLAGNVLNEEKADEYGTPGKFIGTLTKTTVPADGLFISDNKFWYSKGATNIKAFRGWFELGAVLDKETDFSVKMFIDDVETKVDGIGIRDAAGTIYDLGGRKITKPQQRGVYIVNGQKVIVK